MTTMITYKGKKYPTRTLLVASNEFYEPQAIMISVQSLSDDLGDDKQVYGTYEEEIDSMIYFYVEDDKFNLPPDQICSSHLDDPKNFIHEIN
jgi:hypothetical protein